MNATGPAASRIPLFTPDDMTPAQEEVYSRIVNGPRGSVVGPLRAALHVPELADRWQQLGEILRFDTSLPKRLNELAILVTARHWNAQVEWEVHAPAALSAGLDADVLEDICHCRAPRFSHDDEREVYEFARSIQASGDVSQQVYQAIWTRWGVEGAVELSTVVGYYTMVAMTLNVHHIPLPSGGEPQLSYVGNGLAELVAIPITSSDTTFLPGETE